MIRKMYRKEYILIRLNNDGESFLSSRKKKRKEVKRRTSKGKRGVGGRIFFSIQYSNWLYEKSFSPLLEEALVPLGWGDCLRRML
ncbi:MAG: hypothetical protein QXS76_01645 [Candidatus Bathyarchaeia archaeon]